MTGAHTPGVAATAHLHEVRRHVVHAGEGVAARRDLVRLLQVNDQLLAETRVRTMHQLRMRWSGDQPQESAHDDVPDLRDAGVDAALRAAAELLRRWVQARHAGQHVPDSPGLAPFLDWLLAPVADEAYVGDPAATGELRRVRDHAHAVRADPRTPLDEVADAVLAVKTTALCAAGGLTALVDRELDREGLDAVPSTVPLVDPGHHACGADVGAPPPRPAALAALEVAIDGWSDFAAVLEDVVELDVEPRAGRRTTSACLPMADGRSTILASWDGTHDSVASVMHELGHAFLYWQQASAPEVCRAARAVDEQVALDVELRLHVAWSQQLGQARRAYADAVRRRGVQLLVHAPVRLERELRLLRHASQGRLAAARAVLIDEVSVEELRLSPQLVEENLAPARYVQGAARALRSWAPGRSFDVRCRLRTDRRELAHQGASTEALDAPWQRYLDELDAPSDRARGTA